MAQNDGSHHSRGGIARADALTPQQRQEIARKAALARWDDSLPKAAYGSADKPLRIDKLEIPCYVLGDGRRVLVQRGMMEAMDMKQGTAGRGGGDRLTKFVATKAISSFVSNELVEVIKNPIVFQTPNASKAYGYEATVLADLCDAVLEARKKGMLHYQQEHIAAQCEMLVRAFAKVGIIALVDEITGYQEVRDKTALQKILDKYLTAEKAKWAKTFPDDFYRKLFKVRGIPYDPTTVKKPGFIGHDTNNIVYDRLVPGVLTKLKELNPKTEKGYRKDKHHQFFTQDYGVPELKQHILNVMFLMDAAGENNFKGFRALLDRAAPRQGDTLQLDLQPKD